MIRDVSAFLLRLAGFALLLFLIHYYLLLQFSSGQLYFPLWAVYGFNVLMVLAVYILMRYYSKKQPNNMFRLFLILTLSKMALVVVFLLPLFLRKSGHIQLELFNFFIPYFLLLIVEITGLTKFLQKT